VVVAGGASPKALARSAAACAGSTACAVSSTRRPRSNTNTRGPACAPRYQAGGAPDSCTVPLRGSTHWYMRADTVADISSNAVEQSARAMTDMVGVTLQRGFDG